jgi:hypothetical protein
MSFHKTLNRHWRDYAAVVYLWIILCDFFIGPVVWNIQMNSYCNMMVAKGLVCDAGRWIPLTIQGGGILHISFGAILSATAWRKKDEIQEHNSRNKHNSRNNSTA